MAFLCLFVSFFLSSMQIKYFSIEIIIKKCPDSPFSTSFYSSLFDSFSFCHFEDFFRYFYHHLFFLLTFTAILFVIFLVIFLLIFHLRQFFFFSIHVCISFHFSFSPCFFLFTLPTSSPPPSSSSSPPLHPFLLLFLLLLLLDTFKGNIIFFSFNAFYPLIYFNSLTNLILSFLFYILFIFFPRHFPFIYSFL